MKLDGLCASPVPVDPIKMQISAYANSLRKHFVYGDELELDMLEQFGREYCVAMDIRSGIPLSTKNISGNDARFYNARITTLVKVLQLAEKKYLVAHGVDTVLCRGLFQPKSCEEVKTIILSAEDPISKKSFANYFQCIIEALDSIPASGLPLFEVKGM